MIIPCLMDSLKDRPRLEELEAMMERMMGEPLDDRAFLARVD